MAGPFDLVPRLADELREALKPLTALGGDIARMRRGVEAMRKDMAAMREGVEQMRGDTANLRDVADGLQALSEKVGTMSTDLAQMRDDFRTTVEHVEPVPGSLAAVEGAVGEVKDELEELSRTLRRLPFMRGRGRAAPSAAPGVR